MARITFSTRPFADVPLCIASAGSITAIVLVDLPIDLIDPFELELRGSVSTPGVTTLEAVFDNPGTRIPTQRTAVVAAVVARRFAQDAAAAAAARYRELGDEAWLPSRW